MGGIGEIYGRCRGDIGEIWEAGSTSSAAARLELPLSAYGPPPSLAAKRSGLAAHSAARAASVARCAAVCAAERVMVCTRGSASSSDAARHARSVRCTPGGSGAEARRSIAAQ